MMTLQRTKRCSVWVVAGITLIGLAWGVGAGIAAAGDPPVRFQGVIMSRDAQTLVINERPLLLTPETKILSMNKRPVSGDQLVQGQTVAVAAEPATPSGQKIKAIYLLPHRLDGAGLMLLFSEPSE